MGWFPTLPLCFYLAGAKACPIFDRNRRLNAQRRCEWLVA